jgi:hypothetical protein
MMTAAGHLEDMPAHIMQRVGRYEDAAEANRSGVAADLAYYARTKPLDYYVMYTTIEAARQSRALVSDDWLLTTPGFDWYVAELYAAMVRFGMWDDILAEPAPNPKLIGLTGAHLYAKATALADKGRLEEAEAPLSELQKLASADNPGHDRVKEALAVAVLTVRARIALGEGKPDAAIRCCARRWRRRTGWPIVGRVRNCLPSARPRSPPAQGCPEKFEGQCFAKVCRRSSAPTRFLCPLPPASAAGREERAG